MHVISEKQLKVFWDRHPLAEDPLRSWVKLIELHRFRNFAELRRLFPQADQVGRLTVFNIGGNKFRLVAHMHFNTGKVFVRFIGSHADYDRGDWKIDV